MLLSVTSVVEFCKRESKSKEISKNIFFYLTFTVVHMGCQEVPQSDFHRGAFIYDVRFLGR